MCLPVLSWASEDGYEFAPTKTAKSRRQVTLTRAAVAALRRHKVRQAEERMAARVGRTDWEDLDLVFPNAVGRPINASNLLHQRFHPLLKRAGLPRIRFHDLRHTYATIALGRGVPLKVVSDTLGHSSIAITADTYMHVTPGMSRAAADAMHADTGREFGYTVGFSRPHARTSRPEKSVITSEPAGIRTRNQGIKSPLLYR